MTPARQNTWAFGNRRIKIGALILTLINSRAIYHVLIMISAWQHFWYITYIWYFLSNTIAICSHLIKQQIYLTSLRPLMISLFYISNMFDYVDCRKLFVINYTFSIKTVWTCRWIELNNRLSSYWRNAFTISEPCIQAMDCSFSKDVVV